MPLCTLEIPRTGYTPSIDQESIRVCNNALDLTLQGLDIPDPEDHKYRIMVLDGIADARISISFTRGADEYNTGTIFDPPKEKIRATGESIQASVQDSKLEISEIAMEPWSNTTFLIRSDAKEQKFPSSMEFQSRIPSDIGQPIVTLAISPNKLAGFSPFKEGEQTKERHEFQNVGQEILSLIKDTLKLPEQTEGHIEILYPHLAQTDISVEVNFPNISNQAFSPEERLFMARSIENLLNSKQSTRDGSATIWIRQGRPAELP